MLRSDGTLLAELWGCLATPWNSYARRKRSPHPKIEADVGGMDNSRRAAWETLQNALGLKPKDLMMMPARVAMATGRWRCRSGRACGLSGTSKRSDILPRSSIWDRLRTDKV